MDSDTASKPTKMCNKRPLEESEEIPDTQPAYKRPHKAPPAGGYTSIPESPGMEIEVSMEDQTQTDGNGYNVDDFLDSGDVSFDDEWDHQTPLIPKTDVNSIIPVLKPSEAQLAGFPAVVAEILRSWERDYAEIDLIAQQKKRLEELANQNTTRDANKPRAPGETAESPIILPAAPTRRKTTTVYLSSVLPRTADDVMSDMAAIRGHVAIQTGNFALGDELLPEMMFEEKSELIFASFVIEETHVASFNWSDINYKVNPKAVQVFSGRTIFQKSGGPTYVIVVKGLLISQKLLDDLHEGTALRFPNTHIDQIKSWFQWASMKFGNLLIGLSRDGYLHLRPGSSIFVGKSIFAKDVLKKTKDGESEEKRFLVEVQLDFPQDSFKEVRDLIADLEDGKWRNSFYDNIQPVCSLKDGHFRHLTGKYRVGVISQEVKSYLIQMHAKNFFLPWEERSKEGKTKKSGPK